VEDGERARSSYEREVGLLSIEASAAMTKLFPCPVLVPPSWSHWCSDEAPNPCITTQILDTPPGTSSGPAPWRHLPRIPGPASSSPPPRTQTRVHGSIGIQPALTTLSNGTRTDCPTRTPDLTPRRRPITLFTRSCTTVPPPTRLHRRRIKRPGSPLPPRLWLYGCLAVRASAQIKTSSMRHALRGNSLA
jgi:hypothetical protein